MGFDRKRLISSSAKMILSSKLARSIATKQFEQMRRRAVEKEVLDCTPLFSRNVRLDRFYGARALYRSVIRNLDTNFISRKAAKRLVETLIESVMLQGNGREKAVLEFEKKYGIKPPLFITLSPTKKCNLHCKGCYASSKATDSETLDWSTVDKIMREAHDEMGMRFFVISGGEPLMYRSDGKTILDLPRKWKDSLFLMYTNGILISGKVAEEMAELGNITPAISVEGFEEHTDERRGPGVHRKILTAMQNLRDAGVPFGTSVTATRNNVDVLLSDDFYEYYFEEIRATYMWIFQYMPIGREFTTELMITPEQRFELFKKWRQVLSEKQWFVADFWNSAILSSGCISCARSGNGYFYIDWNGNIMPCVFIPYYKHNVKDLFKEGKKIQDALFSDFFVEGRDWQSKYFNQNGKLGNMLMPCFIRDHHEEFLRIARECNVLPADMAAKEAMDDEGYHNALIEFDEKLKAIEEPYWEKEYGSVP